MRAEKIGFFGFILIIIMCACLAWFVGWFAWWVHGDGATLNEYIEIHRELTV